MKKLLSLVLAMLMFAVPCLAENAGVLGSADGADVISGESIIADAIAAGRKVTINVTVPEITGVDTGDPMTDAAIVDLVKALGMRVVMQGDEYDMGLSLSQQDVLTLGVAGNGEDAYIKSNLIGGTIVLSAAEIEPIISRLLDMFVLMEAMTAEEAAEIKAQLPEVLEQYTGEYVQSEAMTPDDLQTLDYSAFEKVYRDILLDLEKVDEIIVPRMCDAATSGIRLSLDNEEFAEIVMSLFRFIQDNPKLENYMSAQMGLFTQEQLDEMWQTYGDYYIQEGLFESEEAFQASLETMPELLDEAITMVDEAKMIDGEFVTTIYFNDAEEIVYLTSVLPLFTEEKRLVETGVNDEINGTTEILNVVYTRQTVAQGVSHVCNIESEGEGLNIDILEMQNAAMIRLSDIATQDTMLTINVNEEGDTLKGTYTTHEEVGVAGSFSYFHLANENQLKTEFAFIAHSSDVVIVNSNENAHALSLGYTCDYARNGADFEGKEVVSFSFDDVKIVLDIDTATSDPSDSIMSGEVVRPAELDDAAFANWFVGVYNSLNSWMGNFLMALPESMLMLIFYTGNMGY